MIVQRFEVVLTAEGWIAMTHCDCGTTITSDPEGNPGVSIGNANAALAGHLRVTKTKRCGTINHNAVQCACDQCKEHDHKLAELIGQGS